MAQPVTFNGSKLYIKIGNGGSPETFSEPCGLTTKGITFNKNTNDVNIPDCLDPDAPSWTGRGVSSLDWEASGSGVLAAAALPDWWDAFNSTESVNIRVGVNAPPTDNGGYWSGKAHLTSFNPSGEIGDKIQVAVTFTSDGAPTWVDAT